MKWKYLSYLLIVLPGAFLFQTCRPDPPVVDIPGSEYPNQIGQIMLTKCAVSGCHNTQSKGATAGLDLSTWNTMFLGDRSGNSVTIPFVHDFSTTFLFTNTFPDLGVSVPPIMPINGAPLTHNEMILLRNWIDQGAPDRNGFVKFSNNPKRKKFYVVNQGCDVVTVFDEATLLPMRYVHIGISPSVDSPHDIHFSPDGQFWYISFLGYPYLQRYNASDDSYAGQVYIGYDSYNTFIITSDSKKAFCVGYLNGQISTVDLTTMTLLDTARGFGVGSFHGSMLNPSNSALYVTAVASSFLVRMDPNDFSGFTYVKLYSGPTAPGTALNPHDIIFSADGTKYFVSCQQSNEVRVMDANTDTLIKIIPVGTTPQDLSISKTKNLLFVTCMEDATTFPGKHGSVYAIDMNTYTSVPVDVGYQPHGISVDDFNGLVYVANRNVNPNGPAPHHTTDCGGRNGYVTMIDLNTLMILPFKKVELVSDPYSIAIRP
jgi:YVTN family beta-propeller protein